MKTFSTDWQAELDAGRGFSSGAVEILSSPPLRVWSGFGDLVLDGETYTGIGDHGLVRVTGSQLGGQEQAVELVLSGVDSDVVGILDATAVRKARVTIRRLGFDQSGQTLLDNQVFARGAVDSLTRESVPGGTSTIKCMVETAARGLGRQTGRTLADADQRMINASDGACARVSMAPELTLAWGGKPPNRAGSSLPTSATPGGSRFDLGQISVL